VSNKEEFELNTLIQLFESRSLDQLVVAGKQYTKKYPHNGSGWNILALGYKNLGNIPEAIKIYEFLVKGAPKSAMFVSNLGNTYMMVGRVSEGIHCYERALELEPNLINAIEALGLAYLEIDQTDKAIGSFKRVIGLDNNHQKSLYYLGNLYLGMGRYQEASDLFQKTSFGLSKSHYLECLYRLGKKELFYQIYNKLVANSVVNPLMASVVSHASVRFGVPDDNPFCSSAFDHIYVGRIEESDGFTSKLSRKLIDYHHGNKNDFRSQDLLTNGKQSSGNLFLLKEDFAQELKIVIEGKIEQYRALFSNSEQGFLTLWPQNYELFGWLISMKSGGNLGAHMHKEGWLSGSFYLNMPESPGKDAGNIAFSLHGVGYPTDGKYYEQKVIEVKQRDICMFPSSLFHSTIPFESAEERISFAFDVKPIS
jgi:tetratricopeptide (TPR) repeat protein